MRLLVINGPNLNLLGIREPEIYGDKTLSSLEDDILTYCGKRNIEVKFFQSNHEGTIVDKIQSSLGEFDGIIINPAAYTHTSIAIPDAIKAVGVPAVEVHLTNIASREDYRRVSYTKEVCIGQFAGEGFAGYLRAADLLFEYLHSGEIQNADKV